MKVLFTGASSFTGFWFVRELVRRGHDVTCVLRNAPKTYTEPLRRRRVEELASITRIEQGLAFGDERFIALVTQGRFEVLCHHAADVTNYKSEDFDLHTALQSNSRGIVAVMQALKASNCQRIVLTGSVFENDEGAGSGGLAAFSPYGLSKGLTWQCFRYFAGKAGLAIGKFVIANPFGPFEEPRFTAYLMKKWMAGETPAVNTPDYVRDNIHVSLLARTYANFVQQLPDHGIVVIRPSGYVESQGAFARRFASEMAPRIGKPCGLELKKQTDFSEPLIRINTDRAVADGFDEVRAWDEIASYYQGTIAAGPSP